MVIQSTGTSLPNLNPLSPGSSPSALSTPLSGGTGYSMADTFEAAPQRAVSGAGYGGGYGGADSANAGYSSLGAGYGTPAGGVQGAAPAGPAVSP
ncbi:MAG TPA: hypothetical protein VFT91_04720, partial [Dehalococcoidia bacterium]|nr:hypothetical protein [Dehalococcoidia bacterium]